MWVAVEEGSFLAGMLLVVAQRAMFQACRLPWFVSELQAQLAPQEVAGAVC